MADNFGGARLIETEAERLARERTEDQRRENRYRYLQLCFNGILTFFTIVTAGIVLYQNHVLGNTLTEMKSQTKALVDTFKEIEKQTKSSADSARAAQDALTLARDTFRQDQRPYIWLTKDLGQPSFIEQSGQFVWSWHVTNYGKSPAYKLKMHQYSKIGNLAFPQFGAKSPDVGPPLPPTGDIFNTVVSSPGMTRGDFDRLFRSDHGLGIMVRIEYFDSYGTRYETSFCYSRLASGALAYCKDNNYIK